MKARRAPTANSVLWDDNLLELTSGTPVLIREANECPFQDAYLNDTLFLKILTVVDYSILVGVDEEKNELVVGIIDYLRQYDALARVESALRGAQGVVTGVEGTVRPPAEYKQRFQRAMERFFLAVPDKFRCFDL